MKLNVVLTVIFISLLPIAADAQEQTIVNNRCIVYGTGSIDRLADRAGIDFSVKGFGPTIQEAVSKARTKVSAIANKLFALGLKETNLHTSQFNSGDNFEGKAFLSSSRDFRGQIDVNVSVDSLKVLEDVVQVLASSEVDHLSNIYYGLKSDSSMKLEARRLAAANAQDKARLIASQLGMTLGKVAYVEELLSDPENNLFVRGGRQIDGAAIGTSAVQDVAFYSQRFSVRASVKVIYELQK